jgi:hypothetical protein
MPTNEWVIVWETGDGPEVDGPYAHEDDAMFQAFLDWQDWGGGIVGGFDEGTLEEFETAYAESDKVWIVPLGKPTREGVAA